MWRTPLGDRILQGAEKRLFQATIASLIDHIEMLPEEPEDYGIEVFGRFTSDQQLFLLAEVAAALFDPAIPSPKLNCVNEATVAAIYGHLSNEIQYELDTCSEDKSEPVYWRRLVVTLLDEDGQETSDPFCPPLVTTCEDFNEWEDAVWAIATYVLWDADWSMDDLFLDVSPELAAARCKKLCINENYYRAIPPDPTKEQVRQARKSLLALVRHPEIL